MIKTNFSQFYKKIILLIILIISFSSRLSAKTVGNYIGIDLIKTNLTFSMEKVYDNKKEKQIETDPTAHTSFGLKYNYAINYKGLFISPGVFYEANDAKNYFNKSSSYGELLSSQYGKTSSKISQRYGAKIDIGVDITEAFSIYGTIGQVMNYYNSYSSIYGDSGIKGSTNPNGIHWKITNGKKLTPLYGCGFRIKLYKNLLLNGEYNYSRFTYKTNATKDYGDYVFNSTTYLLPKQIDINNYVNILK